MKILDEYNICYIFDESFENLKGCGNMYLRFDFQILGDDVPLLIEFDGKQHFQPIGLFGGEKAFKRLVKNDTIKNNYCNNNGYPLLHQI